MSCSSKSDVFVKDWTFPSTPCHPLTATEKQKCIAFSWEVFPMEDHARRFHVICLSQAFRTHCQKPQLPVLGGFQEWTRRATSKHAIPHRTLCGYEANPQRPLNTEKYMARHISMLVGFYSQGLCRLRRSKFIIPAPPRRIMFAAHIIPDHRGNSKIFEG